MIRPATTPTTLRKARVSHSRAIADFLKCKSKFPSEVVWVFEGKDVKYYSLRVEIITGKRAVAVVNAGGKENVLKVHGFVSANQDSFDSSYACFVDKDFDRHPEKVENLYVTPTYSIENFYVSDSFLAKVLQAHFDFNSHADEKYIYIICRKYRAWLKNFLSSVHYLNAWILLQKGFADYRLNLSSVSLTKLVALSWNAAKLKSMKKYTLRILSKLFPMSKKLRHSDVLNAMSEFQAGEFQSNFRGKYFVDFVFEAISRLISDAKNQTPLLFNRKKTVTLGLSKVNFISDLAGYADTPVCLRNFISSFLQKAA